MKTHRDVLAITNLADHTQINNLRTLVANNFNGDVNIAFLDIITLPVASKKDHSTT